MLWVGDDIVRNANITYYAKSIHDVTRKLIEHLRKLLKEKFAYYVVSQTIWQS